jgi:hypothetical protein
MTRNRSLSSEKRHKIAQIKEAPGKSDGPMHGYMSNLDLLDRSAKQDATRDVSGQQIRILEPSDTRKLTASDCREFPFPMIA